MQQESLIKRIKEQIFREEQAAAATPLPLPKLPPPASLQAIQAAEQALGFPLSPLLRQLYMEIANGDFGPPYGLIPLSDGTPKTSDNIVRLYHQKRRPRENDPAFQWPEKLLPICDLGCGMLACINCREEKGPIVWYEPNPRETGDPLELFLIPLAPSLEAWLIAWLDDKDLMQEAYQKSELKVWLAATYGSSETGSEEPPF